MIGLLSELVGVKVPWLYPKRMSPLATTPGNVMFVQCGAPHKIAKLVQITAISLGFMVVITIFRWGYKPTDITRGPHIIYYNPSEIWVVCANSADESISITMFSFFRWNRWNHHIPLMFLQFSQVFFPYVPLNVPLFPSWISLSHDGSVCMPYMVCHLPSIYPNHVSINLPYIRILWVYQTTYLCGIFPYKPAISGVPPCMDPPILQHLQPCIQGSERLGDPSHASARFGDPGRLVFGQGARGETERRRTVQFFGGVPYIWMNMDGL